MRKVLLRFLIAIIILGASVFLFMHFFEIVEEEKKLPVSKEARANKYLALDRWLISEGYTVKTISYGSSNTLKSNKAKTVFIQNEIFDWNEDTINYLDSLVRSGGKVIISLNYFWLSKENRDLLLFMEKLGIKEGPHPDEWRSNYDDEYPNYGRNLTFSEPENLSALVFKDEDSHIRLIQIPLEKGTITVMGNSNFMMSYNLEKEANARLCWHLFGSDTFSITDAEILFIRGEKKPEKIVGKFFEKGNFYIVIISVIILIVAGLWSVIPVFGLVKGSEEKPGKTLAERFRAEGIFMRRFGALDDYRAVYIREIRRRLLKKERLNENELMNRATHIWAAGNPEKITEAEKAFSPKPQSKKYFMESIFILKTILERL